MGRVAGEALKVRRHSAFRYAARSWKTLRQVVARIEASHHGTGSRFVVTNLKGAPRWLYEAVYCARGQAENRIKAHKLHLASDRTSCTRATANRFRLLVHTAACWLLHRLRGLAPKTSFWRDAQLDSLRQALIKSLPSGSTRGSPPGSPSWSPASRWHCRRAIPRPVPGRCSPTAPSACRPDARGSVPLTKPVSPTPNPDHPRPRRHPEPRPREPRSPPQAAFVSTLVNEAG